MTIQYIEESFCDVSTGECSAIIIVEGEPPTQYQVRFIVNSPADVFATLDNILAADCIHTSEMYWNGTQLIAFPQAPNSAYRWDWETYSYVTNMSEEIVKKTAEINTACRADIIGGFTSSALGAPHVYDSEETDQANLTGQRQRAQLTGQAQLYKCLNPETGIKEWISHTPEQLDQVFLDGAMFKENLLVQATLLKQQIAAATTYEEIQAITWESP